MYYTWSKDKNAQHRAEPLLIENRTDLLFLKIKENDGESHGGLLGVDMPTMENVRKFSSDSASSATSRDELAENDTIDELRRFHVIRQTSRRVSVFSKTYDPDEPMTPQTTPTRKNAGDDDGGDENYDHDDRDSPSSTNGLNDEDVANKVHEYNAMSNFESLKMIRNKNDEETLKKVLLSIVLFKHLDKENIDSIVDSMFERRCARGECIIREGDEGKYFYVIMSGSFDVYKMNKKNGLNASENDFGVKVASLKDKGFFGELSLLYDQVIDYYKSFIF